LFGHKPSQVDTLQGRDSDQGRHLGNRIAAVIIGFYSCYRQIGYDGSPNVDFNGIFGESPKILDDDVLLNPLEENLYIPTVTIKIGDFQCADFKVIGYEINNGIIVRVIYSYESHILRIELAGLVSGDTNPRVFYDTWGRIGDSQLLDGCELHVLFWA